MSFAHFEDTAKNLDEPETRKFYSFGWYVYYLLLIN